MPNFSDNEGRQHPLSVHITRAALRGFAEILLQVVAGVAIVGGGIAMALVFL